MSETPTVLLCPGQGAQAVGMGKGWFDSHPLSAQTLAAADETVTLEIDGAHPRLSDLCFAGPEEHLNRTDVSQPALYACGVASYQGLLEERGTINLIGAAGLSLGEWTALHLAGTFGFIEGLRLVALRGRLMQEAAENSAGSMVALIGADEDQADEVCAEAVGSDVLVPANFNAPGQIVISGSKEACLRAVTVSEKMGNLRKVTAIQVTGNPLEYPFNLLLAQDPLLLIKVFDVSTKELDLSHVGLDSIPDFLGRLVNLERLDLSYNRITVFPSMHKLDKLERLNLSFNPFANSFPLGICDLKNLKELNLDYTGITTVSEFDRLVLARGRPAGHRGATGGAVLQNHFRLEGRISA